MMVYSAKKHVSKSIGVKYVLAMNSGPYGTTKSHKKLENDFNSLLFNQLLLFKDLD